MKVGKYRRESSGKEIDMVWACEKRGGLCRKEGDGNRSACEEDERKAEEVVDGQSENTSRENKLSGEQRHGGKCHRTSTTHKIFTSARKNISRTCEYSSSWEILPQIVRIRTVAMGDQMSERFDTNRLCLFRYPLHLILLLDNNKTNVSMICLVDRCLLIFKNIHAMLNIITNRVSLVLC